MARKCTVSQSYDISVGRFGGKTGRVVGVARTVLLAPGVRSVCSVELHRDIDRSRLCLARQCPRCVAREHQIA